MPGSLVNNTLSSLNAGVTQQYQEGRFDSQVEEMENCTPSLTRGVLRRNPIQEVANLSGVPADLTDAYVYSYDRGTGTEQYIVIIPGDGYIHVFNANTGAFLYKNSTVHTYLQVSGSDTAKESFEALTIGDHTFLINKTKTIDMTSAVSTSDGYEDMAFYWIKKTTSVVSQQKQSGTDPITSGSLMLGYEYRLNGTTVAATEDTRPGETPIDVNTSKKIAEAIKDDYVYSLATSFSGSVAYNDNFAGTDWSWDDTFGNEASLGVWTTLDDAEKLPAQIPAALDGFIVKISGGTSAEFDDYFLKYSDSTKTWKETTAPGVKTTLDPATMPHVLYRLTGGFLFDEYEGIITDGSALDGVSKWESRTSGGLDELQDPSFIGNTLNNIFFHKNRLGFLTDDNIILSSTGEYGKFFVSTIQNVLDDDVIDLAVASTDVTILRHAVSTAGSLVLFSDDTQFQLTALEGPLTPNSADISPLSNYTYGKGANAKAIGNRIFFSNQAGGYSQIYSYKISDKGSQVTEAIPMTLHIPSYIDKSVSRIIGHDVLGYTFLEIADTPKELIVLTSVVRGKEDLQNAFHKWTFDKEIVSTHIINNELYILFKNGDLTHMLLETPGDFTNTSYLDRYNVTDGDTEYTSHIKFSEFFIRDGEGKGTVRGRYQLRTMQYTIEDDSKYVTTIANTASSLFDEDIMFGTAWVDADDWDDTLLWVENDPYYTRVYTDDDKVTVMSDSKKVEITFSSSTVEPSKGFILSTANLEGFFFQRSSRI